MKLLLAFPTGIQVNLVDNEGLSALIEAAGEGHEGIVRCLLASSEIQVNLVDQNGWSAIMWAAAKGYEGIVSLLLGRPDIQVNLVNRYAWSALMLASHTGHVGMVALLLAADDVEVNLTNDDGDTALKLAAQMGDEAIVRLLLGVGHIDTKTKSHLSGQTAATAAWAEGHEDIVELLREFESQEIGGVVGEMAFEDVVDLAEMSMMAKLREDSEAVDESGSEGPEVYQDAEEWVDEE